MNKSIPLTKFVRSCLSCKYISAEVQLHLSVSMNNQLIVKANKFIVFCCRIPYNDIKEIIVERFHNDCIVLLKSSKSAGVVSFCQRKVLEWYDNVDDILISDYLNIGHDQIVVIKGSDFIITDFRCCFINTTKKDEKSDQSGSSVKGPSKPCSGYEIALKAVENKIKSAELQCNDLQVNISNKQEFLQHSVNVLKNLTLGRSSKPLLSSKCNYVNLLSKDLQVVDSSKDLQQTHLSNHNPFKVIEKSVFICNDDLLVTVHVRNESRNKLCNISLSVLTQSNSTCKSTVYFPKLDTTGSNSKRVFKDLKMDESYRSDYFLNNEQLVLTASMKLGNLQLQGETLFLMIHYEMVGVNEMSTENDKFLHACKNLSVCVDIFNITPNDIITGKYRTCLTEMNTEQLNTYYTYCYIKHSFELSSIFTNLKDLPYLLSKRFQCSIHHLGVVTILELHHIKAHIRLTSSTSKSECVIYTTTDAMFTMLCKEFNEIMPGDVTMNLITNKDMTKPCLLDLKQEITAQTNKLKVLRELQEKNKNIVCIDDDDNDDDKQSKKKRKRKNSEVEVDTNSFVSKTNNTFIEALKTITDQS